MSDVLWTVALTGLCSLFVIVPLWWAFSSGDRWLRRLKKRAAAGDLAAQVELARAEDLLGAMRRATRGADSERARLLAIGRPARATIINVRPLGMELSVSAVPMRMIEVEIKVDGDAGHPITVRDAISELYFGRLLKGATVPVRVDPVDGKRVAVLWDTL